jgi:hypothetical protein
MEGKQELDEILHGSQKGPLATSSSLDWGYAKAMQQYTLSQHFL